MSAGSSSERGVQFVVFMLEPPNNVTWMDLNLSTELHGQFMSLSAQMFRLCHPTQ